MRSEWSWNGKGRRSKPTDPGDPEKRDNLYEPRSDGEVRGAQDLFVRRTSLLLEAQKHPLSLPLFAGALGVQMLADLAERVDAARIRARKL